MHRRKRTVLFVAALVSLGIGGSAHAAPCNAAFVKVGGKTVTVLPTGGDDTANLQCAFDLAARLGSGITVQLAAGTFQTAQLVVKGMRGSIRGMGQAATTVKKLQVPLTIDRPDCQPTSLACFADAPPAADNRYPSLISILGNDLALADLSIRVVDTYGTASWYMWGSTLTSLANVIQVIGSYCTLKVERVTVDSGSAYAPLAIWTFSRAWFVTGSNFSVLDSTFTPNGIVAYNLKHAQVALTGNRFALGNGGTALMVSDDSNTLVQFTRNTVTAMGTGAVGVYGWAGHAGTGVKASSLVVDGNVLAGESALVIAPGAFNDVTCRASGNNILGVTGTPFVLNGNPCAIGTKR